MNTYNTKLQRGKEIGLYIQYEKCDTKLLYLMRGIISHITDYHYDTTKT